MKPGLLIAHFDLRNPQDRRKPAQNFVELDDRIGIGSPRAAGCSLFPSDRTSWSMASADHAQRCREPAARTPSTPSIRSSIELRLRATPSHSSSVPRSGMRSPNPARAPPTSRWIRTAIPPDGLGRRHAQLMAWLDENCGFGCLVGYLHNE